MNEAQAASRAQEIAKALAMTVAIWGAMIVLGFVAVSVVVGSVMIMDGQEMTSSQWAIFAVSVSGMIALGVGSAWLRSEP